MIRLLLTTPLLVLLSHSPAAAADMAPSPQAVSQLSSARSPSDSLSRAVESLAAQLDELRARHEDLVRKPAPLAPSIIAAVSCVIAFLGLVFTGRQSGKLNEATRQSMYFAILDKYLALKNDILTNPDLEKVESRDIPSADLTPQQRHYVHKELAFCEALFLTKQIEAFPKIAGASWKNYIIDTMQNVNVKRVWRELTDDPTKSNFAKAFIDYVRALPGVN